MQCCSVWTRVPLLVRRALSERRLAANDDQLRLLYDELVRTHIVSDEEFWQLRTEDVKAMAMRGRAQQRGMATSALDIEPAAR